LLRVLWPYLLCAALWIFFFFWWLLPVARRGLGYEVFACLAVGTYFSMLALTPKLSAVKVPALTYVGWALFVPAAILTFPSFYFLRRGGKPASGWEETTTVTARGVYRVARHPMYFGTALFGVALALVLQSLAAAGLACAVIVFAYAASRLEEKRNLEKFGDGYRSYVEEVPRWNIVLGLWRAAKRRGAASHRNAGNHADDANRDNGSGR
jgi:protein-S-isoprenylcysteine O-methyltransferase Ste14